MPAHETVREPRPAQLLEPLARMVRDSLPNGIDVLTHLAPFVRTRHPEAWLFIHERFKGWRLAQDRQRRR
jgi:hypothetical protein